jgi:hypothetical protein
MRRGAEMGVAEEVLGRVVGLEEKEVGVVDVAG